MGNKGKNKGTAFEREFCSMLSLWWTKGERDDVFWRTAGSGARATNRGRRGLKTYGHHGDVLAADPIGEPFTKMFTVELKRGYPTVFLDDLICPPRSRGVRKGKRAGWKEWIQQAEKESAGAGTPYWMIVYQRNRRYPFVVFPSGVYDDAFIAPCVLPTAWFTTVDGDGYLVCPLDAFLDGLDFGRIMKGTK